MALKPCRECKATVSSDAKTCPNCGISKPVKSSKLSIVIFTMLSLVIAFIIFSPKNENVSNKAKLSPEQQAELNYQKACSKDYKACKSNADIININTELNNEIAAACIVASENNAISKIDWGGFTSVNFGSFVSGDSGLKENKIVVIDKSAMYTNKFGAKVKAITTCVYNLKENKVEDILVN